MYIFVMFLFNTCLASFIACFSERRHLHISLWTRSCCMSCKKTIPFRYLIPIVGFLLTHRKCIYCKTSIPPALFLIELIGAFNGIFIGIFINSIHIACLLTATATLFLLISFDDWQTQLVHDSDLVIYALLSIGLFIYTKNSFNEHFFGMLLILLPLLLIYYIFPEHLGNGDIIFLTIAGFHLGIFFIPYAFAIGTFLALIYSLLLLYKKKAAKDTAIPMIPFLASGVWCTLLYQFSQFL